MLASEIRGRKNAAHQRAIRDWQGELPDPAIIKKEIQPSLRELPIRTLAAATGLSEHYCSLIRLGKKIPHPRHWDVLKNVYDGTRAESPTRLAYRNAGRTG